MRFLPAVLLCVACVPEELQLNPSAHLDFDGQGRPVALSMAGVSDRRTCASALGDLTVTDFQASVRRAFEHSAIDAGFRLAPAHSDGTEDITIDQMTLGCSPVHAALVWSLDYRATSSDGARAHGHLQRIGGWHEPTDTPSMLVAEAIEDLAEAARAAAVSARGCTRF